MRWSIAVLIVSLAGCHGLTIGTRDHVWMHTPVVMNGKFVQETPPTTTDSPVREVALGSTCACKAPKVAIVDVDGLLLNSDFTGPFSAGENPVAAFREKLDAASRDPAVCAVVLRINSPGGGVTASDVLWHDVLTFKAQTHKPVVACLLDLGCGGAYYLATAADQIVAHPTSITGGVGVILNLYNLRDAMAYFNVSAQRIKAGSNIDMGTSVEKLPEEAKTQLQAMAEEFHERFRQVVKRARPGIDAADANNFDGRVFTAGQALERHFVDRIGYLDDAVALAKQMSNQQNACPVLYRRCNDPAHSIYAVTANVPLQSSFMPISVPGLDRARLPTFLYLWQPEATLEKLAGK
jgi:protease-4